MQEISINVIQKNGTIDFNDGEIKEALAAEMKFYKGMIFTEDTKKAAKDAVAYLRKLKKELDDRKKEVKRSFMEPYTCFESKVKELNELIDEPIASISGQIEEFEKKRIEERKQMIKTLYEENILDLAEYLPLERIYNSKWENATTTKKAITEEITGLVRGVQKDLETIQAMESEYEEKGIAAYKKNRSLADAIQCIHSYEKQETEILARQKEQAEAAIRETEKPQEQQTAQQDAVECGIPADCCESFMNKPEKPCKGERAIYEVNADIFQIAQLESAMREFGITYRRVQ